MTAKVGIYMGSRSDLPVMKHASATLKSFGVAYEEEITSAHRTPDRMRDFAMKARDKGIKVIIAGAGGAAHLPGMMAAYTHIPVLGVPMKSRELHGVDSFISIVQMPAGVPVGTLAIGKAGAVNAALLAVGILALDDAALEKKLIAWRKKRSIESTSKKLGRAAKK